MKQFLRKCLALLTAISLLAQNFIPQKTYALTGGPSSPEFSNFESVSTSNMVDPFTGDFTYNIPILEVPGPNGGGYPVSLSYHSGSGPEEEASWVGFGWTLNAGAITRNKQGFPDDADGDAQININKVDDNVTWSIGADLGASVAFNVSNILDRTGDNIINDLLNFNIGGGVNVVLTHNNHIGSSFQVSPHFNTSIAAYSCNVSTQDGEFRYTSKVDPAYWVSGVFGDVYPEMKGYASGICKTVVEEALRVGTTKLFNKQASSPLSYYGNKSYTLYNQSAPTVLQDYSGFSGAVSLEGRLYYGIPVGGSAAINANYTIQSPKDRGISIHKYYGYIKSHNVVISGDDADNDALMDYTVEKQDVYNLRDNYLPIPVSGADLFSVSGEGVSGTFTAKSSSVGYFRPNEQTSKTTLISIGAFVGGPEPVAFGVNVDIGAGKSDVSDKDKPDNMKERAESAADAISSGGHLLSVSGWDDAGYNFSNNQDMDEPYYFSFLGDLGGGATFHSEDDRFTKETASAKMAKSSSENDWTLKYDSDVLNKKVNQDQNGLVGRASYIGYHTNKAMLHNKDGSNNYYDRFSYRSDSYISSDFSREENENIGEYDITNPNGTHYLYSLPVYSKNEMDISIGITPSEKGNIKNHFFAEKDLTNLHSYLSAVETASEDGELSNDDLNSIKDQESNLDCQVTGDIRNDKYPNSYLLTQITQSNYIDVNGNGPDDGDIGGWTKFSYEKYDDNFNWRVPYYGLLVNEGKFSDPKDDFGYFSFGEKEVYYLNTIETATHIAVFSTSEREDGLEAAPWPDGGTSGNTRNADRKHPKKLDQIILYAKDDDNSDLSDNPVIKRIYFNYDYSAWPGIPNNTNWDDNSNETNDGKLTLKSLYVEYQNVYNSTVSPYKFEYTYPDLSSLPSNHKYEKNEETGEWEDSGKDIYKDIIEFRSPYQSTNVDGFIGEQPQYSIYNTDRWNAYRENGSTLCNNLFLWVDQTPASTFDPAAWQLKRIILPTKGEIQVQYEQDDYQYVQDRKAMAMVKLELPPDDVSKKGYDDDGYNYSEDGMSDYNQKYYVDLSELGIDDKESMDKMKDYIQKIMVDGYGGRKSEMAFFKFLYNISTGTDVDLNNCNTDYIDGYIRLSDPEVEDINPDASLDDYKLYFELGDAGSVHSDFEWTCPRHACTEFFKTTRGNLNEYVDCDGEDDFSLELNNVVSTTSPTEIISDVYKFYDELFDFPTGDYYGDVCKPMDADHSYIRLPLPYGKKGGGIRVKRLLTYDPGIESDNADEALYGHEYLYIDKDGFSSGVATNEPSLGNTENALIGFMHRREESSDAQKMAAGEDRSQFTGPLGESVLPSPMVGYSRVLVRNIYSGATHDGIHAYEYYTTKDYPFDKKYDFTDATTGEEKKFKGVQHSELNLKTQNSTDWYGIAVSNSYCVWATQGYRFIINSMNGQIKKEVQYSGNWEDYNQPTSLMEISSSKYEYYQPGEAIPVLDADGNSSGTYLGASSDVITESKLVLDKNDTWYRSLEIGWEIPCPIPYVIPIPYKINDDTYIHTHVTTETDYYPSVLKKVTNYQDGAVATVNNVYFDKTSGNPIVTSKAGIYDDLKYACKSEDGTTAYKTYHGKYFNFNIPATFYYDMGQKAGFEGYSFSSGDNNITAEKQNRSDTYISLTGSNFDNVLAQFHVGDLIALNPKGNSTKEIYNVTRVSTDGSGLAGYIYIAPASNFYSSTTTDGEVEIKILRSGMANILGISAGNILTCGEEFEGLSGRSWNGILSASALTYKNSCDIADELKENYGLSTTNTNTIETAEAGKWYVDASYVYKTDLENEDEVFLSGKLNDFTPFNWNDVSGNSSKWLNTEEMETYAPDGNALQSKNVLNIHSAVKFGYDNALPNLTIQNSEYDDALFESFEYTGGDALNLTPTSDCAHTGSKSTKLSTTAISSGYWGVFNISTSKSRTEQAKNSGLSVKMWVKTGASTPTIKLLDASVYTRLGTDGKPASTETPNFSDITFESVAKTGEWTLYEAKLTPSKWKDYDGLNARVSTSTVTAYGLEVYIETDNSNGVPSIYEDDIRVQPLNSQMVAYVYDPSTYKILATLDDQNFAMLYQYNDEGKLIRKEKETVRGVKTLVETQYNIPTQDR